jgi:arylsulfatase A-like enzyme
MYPTNHGIVNHGPKVTREELQQFNKNRIKLLPEILKQCGYTTLAVDWLGRWHRRGYDFYSGLSTRGRYIDFKKRVRQLLTLLKSGRLNFGSIKRLFDDAPFGIRTIEEANYVGSKAINLIKNNRNNNFFLFIHFWDTHAYHFKGKTIDEKIKKYDEAISAVDREIGRIISTLEEFKILDETLIIITADHGESLTEHQIYFDHHGLYDESIHVPLIMTFSEFPKGKRIKGFVQHFDIVPTILEVVGVRVATHFDGRSLLPLIRGEVEKLRSEIYAEETYFQKKKAIRTSKYKYIFAESEKDAICRACNRIHGGIEELYDLDADPGENINIIKERPDIARQLRNRYFDWIKSTRHKIEKERVKQEIRRLKSIGWI